MVERKPVQLMGIALLAGSLIFLPGGCPALMIKDTKGGIVGVFVDAEFDMRALQTAEPGEAPPESHRAEFGLPLASDERTRPMKPGVYDVYVSIGTLTGTPTIALPLPNDDGHHRYRLGKLKVSP